MRYTRVGYPWAGGLGTNVSDCTTAKEVMEKAKLNFNVDKCQLVAKMPFGLNKNNELDEEAGDFAHKGNIYREIDSAYATYRTDLNLPFGIVKSKYEVVQNIDAFNFFDDAIGEDKAIWQYAGSLGYGHKIFVTAKIPFVSQIGNNDPVENYLVFSNSHDGTSSVDIMFTPLRVICTNMLSAGINSATSHLRLRHTKTVQERLEQGSQILKIACQYAEDSQALYSLLNTIPITDHEVMDYICTLILSDEEYKNVLNYDKQKGFERIVKVDQASLEACKISTRKANQIRSIFESYLDGIGQKNIVGTAWGAYNGVTNYYSNVINLEGERRTESLLWGNANKQITKALGLIMEAKAA